VNGTPVKSLLHQVMLSHEITECKISQNITKSRSATAKLIINMFVVDLIIGLAATTGAEGMRN
jgi:hypothetical protein